MDVEACSRILILGGRFVVGILEVGIYTVVYK